MRKHRYVDNLHRQNLSLRKFRCLILDLLRVLQKLVNIDPKTMIWLADKPGTTFREKLALAGKVTTDVKRYSHNIHANQAVIAFYKRIHKLLMKKIEAMKKYPDLFGNTEENDEVKKLLLELRKVDYIIKKDFSEVIPKDIPKANNALLGNTDYRCVWNTYVDLKHGMPQCENVFEEYREMLYRAFIVSLLGKYNYIERAVEMEDIASYVIYSVTQETLSCMSFEIEDVLRIKKTDRVLKDGRYVVVNEKADTVSVSKTSNQGTQERGMEYSLKFNANEIGLYFADLLGLNDTICKITELLNLDYVSKIAQKDTKIKTDFVSINAFDNMVYGVYESGKNGNINGGEVKVDCPIVICDRLEFVPSDVYYCDGTNLFLPQKESRNYLSLLKNISSRALFNDKLPVIYDINDSFDEFSSMELRKNFSAAFPKAYPVWRSILGGEAWNKICNCDTRENIDYIVDLCGSEFSVSKLGTKNLRFVHYGAQEVPIYIARDKYNEKDFLEDYLREYQKKRFVYTI